MSDRNVDQHPPEVFRHLRSQDVSVGVDAQLATGTLALPPVQRMQVADRHFSTTEDFWRAVLWEEVRALRTVVLHEVLLSEWFPRSPGLYHTEQAAWARERARLHVLPLSEERQATYQSSDPLAHVVYDLYGKLEMLRGGVGCIRLNRRVTPDGPLWFMSAATGLSAEQGVPLALTDTDYQRYINDVTMHGVLPCTVTGKLMVLPESMLSLYRDYSGVPYLYILVEELVPARSATVLQRGRPTVSVAVMFKADEPWPAVNATYVDVVPGRNGNLNQRLPWLDYYVAQLHGGTVITDFDEQMTRFPHAVFSLQKVANGTLEESELAGVADVLRVRSQQIHELLSQQRLITLTVNRFHIEVGKVHVGDEFSNIGAGAVIINRSTLTNALNSVQSDHGLQAAEALQRLAEVIEQSGKPEADTLSPGDGRRTRPAERRSLRPPGRGGRGGGSAHRMVRRHGYGAQAHP
ncbi:MAG: hypothetical protein ACRDTE_23800, partial [Pseudonocardiaceae bacterium]